MIKLGLPKHYKTIQFGHYMQDKNGQTMSPISWYILDKKDDRMLLITEKVIDHMQFSALGKNDWATSDLRNDVLLFINTSSLNCGFTIIHHFAGNRHAIGFIRPLSPRQSLSLMTETI